jgi:hypothetical protein
MSNVAIIIENTNVKLMVVPMEQIDTNTFTAVDWSRRDEWIDKKYTTINDALGEDRETAWLP